MKVKDLITMDLIKIKIGKGSLTSAIKIAFTLMLVSSFTIVKGADVDAGEDQYGCPGEELTIGGEPTAGPGDPSSYTYEWISSDGSFSSSEANPTIIVQDQIVIYTVIVEDQDGFRCDDSMIVRPVKVENISFDKPSLPADGTSTVTASAVITPPDRTVVWSIEGDDKGCSVNPNSGVITAGTESGYITVRAQDSEAAEDDTDGCYKEKQLCVGEECCEEISGSRTFGPITIDLSETIQSKGQDEDGFCIYEVASAGVSIEMLGGVFSSSYAYDLQGVTVTWKEKRTDNSYEFKEVNINWSGSESTREFGPFQANLTQVGLTVSSGGSLSGTTSFTINQTQDVSLGGIAKLKAGTNGSFTYRYTSSSSFSGEWDFGGINGIKINLEKGSTAIGTLTGSMDKQGNLNAKFRAATPGTYSTNGFTAQVTQLDLGIIWNISDNNVDFQSGNATVKVKDVKPHMQGEVVLNVTFSGGSANATATLNNVRAFGCDISGELAASFTFDFDINGITGSGISAKHPDFDQSFSNVGFEIANGEIARFDIGAIEVKYKGNISFSMTNASYSGESIVFNAALELAGQKFDVNRFTVDGAGTVSIGRVRFSVDKSPVKVSADLSFQENEFKGSYSGEFKGGVGISGAVVLGGTGSFNYAYFALAASAGRGGVPLGASGLKVNELGGEFGYNWSPGESFGSISGSPSQGTTVIGFLLGIGDVANLAELQGRLRVVLGDATQLDIDGTVKVTASSPHYLKGSMSLTYVLGTTTISGSLNSTVKFPPRSGSVIKLNTGNINFGVEDNSWYVNGAGMNGKIFNAVDVSASINMGSPLNNVFGFTGDFSGSVSYQNQFDYRYPGAFDPSTCETADATDNVVGFGITGNLNIELGGSLNTSINSDGFAGKVEVSASGESDMYVKWPCAVTCGSECVDNYYTAMSGLVGLEHTGSDTRMYGEVTFTSGDETEQGDIDFTF